MPGALRYTDSKGKEWIFVGTREKSGSVEIKLRHPEERYLKYVDYEIFIEEYKRVGK